MHTHTHARTHTQVRRHTAEQLYLALLALEPQETGGPEGGVPEEEAEAAQVGRGGPAGWGLLLAFTSTARRGWAP